MNLMPEESNTFAAQKIMPRQSNTIISDSCVAKSNLSPSLERF